MSSRSLPPSGKAGFTLIEVIIALLIVGVLAAVALPAYFDQIRKSRRADAIAAMAQVQQAQERYRANSVTFGSHFIVTGGALTGVGAAGDPGAQTGITTAGGYYSLSIPPPASGAAGTSYNVRAQALGGQTRDTSCAYMQMAAAGGNVSYLSGPTSALGNSTSANNLCWRR